jgi:hypothetical protein
MGKGRISELCSQTLLEEEDKDKRYDFRIISYPDKEGTLVYKFGVSVFWYSEQLSRWLPHKKHHVFLPFEAWPALVSCAKLLDAHGQRTATGDNGGNSSGNAVEPQQQQQPDAPAAACAGGRRRGRPPKRAHEQCPAVSADPQAAKEVACNDQEASSEDSGQHKEAEATESV